MRRLPILLIHGFNSTPEMWYESGFVEALSAGGLDPALIEPFFYGEAADGTYDNRGNVAVLAGRLAAAIRELAAASQAAGGPGRVTLIGHSLGGLIARYYLSCREPDPEHGTRYAHDVSRLITLGTPHLGVPLSEAADLIPRNSRLWTLIRLIESLPFLSAHPAGELEELRAQLEFEQEMAKADAFYPPPPGPGDDLIAQVTLEDSEALRQIQPDSPLFRRINATGAMPDDVEYHLIYGNVALLVEMAFWGVPLFRSEISLGDGAVPASSASHLPHTAFTSFEVPFKKQWRLEIGRKPAENVAGGIADLLPYALHTRLYAHQAVQHDILARLGVMT